MLWSALMHLAGFVVDLVIGARRTVDAKEPEIALLRHQILCWLAGTSVREWRDWRAARARL